MQDKLRKVPERKWVAGICAGLAYYIGCPVWIVRLVWFVITLSYGFGLLAYILLWMFLPKWGKTPKDFDKVTGD
ncbi:MAG: PspC domain-containing protein [Candidatus Paceibacterota bacterium]